MTSDAMFRQQIMGVPIAPDPRNREPHLVTLYNLYTRGKRAEASWQHWSVLEIERHAIKKTIMYGFRDRYDLMVSELFLEGMYDEIDVFLHKVGHHTRHEVVQVVSDYVVPSVHRARLILGDGLPKIRAEIKLGYDRGPNYIAMKIPILEPGEKE